MIVGGGGVLFPGSEISLLVCTYLSNRSPLCDLRGVDLGDGDARWQFEAVNAEVVW